MRLLYFDDTGRLRLTDYLYEDIPPYAILSHRWGTTQDEVSYLDITGNEEEKKAGWTKLRFCGEQARKDNLKYFWVDTCCIDKGDARELSRSIASMFKWYAEAQQCYVYLADVTARPFSGRVEQVKSRPWERAFRRSQWFTRGWTLQELLAPSKVSFFSYEGLYLGSRAELSSLILAITGIDKDALHGRDLSEYSEAVRFRWAVHRQTFEPEDQAYCLLGIFGVSMPPYYGEGEDCAYDRLKEEILKKRRNDLIRLDPKAGRHEVIRPDDESILSSSSSMARPASISTRSASFMTAKSKQSLAQSLGVTDLPSSAMSRMRRAAIIRLIRFDAMESRRRTIKLPLNGTCQWVLHHEAYQAWIKPKQLDHSFLWIRGHPGAGKSTLLKFMDYHLTDSTKGQAKAVISFYFNARGESLETTAVGAYRSLIAQLLEIVPDLDNVLDRLRFGRTNLPDSTFFEHAPVAVLQELLAGAVSQLGDRQIYCLLDALDETDEEDVLELVDFLRTLRQGSRIMTCFASRHYPTFDITDSVQIVLDHETGHTGDILSYIDAHLRIGLVMHDLIKAELRTRANGIFLWVMIAIAILNTDYRRGSVYSAQQHVQQRLSAVPLKLSSLFREICTMGDIAPDDFLLCLQWLLFAARPLSLEEFYFALRSGLSTLDGSNLDLVWETNRLTRKNMENTVITYSKGLAEVTTVEPYTVQLIHESARQFLLSSEGLASMYGEDTQIVTSVAHERLKLCCDTGILFGLRNGWLIEQRVLYPTSIGERHHRADVDKLPFTSYAVEFVLHHAEQASPYVDQDDFLLCFPAQDWLKMAVAIPSYENLWAKTIVDVMIELGHCLLLQTLLSRTPLPESSVYKGLYATSSLEIAIARGRLDVVELLLYHGARPRAHNLQRKKSYGQHGASVEIQGILASAAINETMTNNSRPQLPLSWCSEAVQAIIRSSSKESRRQKWTGMPGLYTVRWDSQSKDVGLIKAPEAQGMLPKHVFWAGK